MHVVGLKAENFKRLKVVDVRFEGNLIQFTGRNAQGKTSALDALFYALVGGKAGRDIPRPIRDGQKMARVVVDLEDVVVTRTWERVEKEGVESISSTVTVVAKDGGKYSSPQKFLDEKLGAISFDPLEFTRQDAKTQLATLLGLVELSFDPAALDRRRRTIFDERTNVNRDLRNAEGVLSDLSEPGPDVPTSEVSARSVLEEKETYDRSVEAHRNLVAARDDAKSSQIEAERLVEDLKRQLVAAGDNVLRYSDLHRLANDQLAIFPEPDPIDFSERLASIESVNADVRAARQWAVARGNVEGLRHQVEDLTETLNSIDADKANALANAKMPTEGLSFDDEGVLYNGRPLKNASSSEQLRVSMAIAMAQKPEIRVAFVRDGSLLDAESVAMIEEMAKANDFQVIMEVVDGDVGFVVEDGAIVQHPEEETK